MRNCVRCWYFFHVTTKQRIDLDFLEKSDMLLFINGKYPIPSGKFLLKSLIQNGGHWDKIFLLNIIYC